MSTKKKQSMRLYIDTDAYRELLRQAANKETLKTPAEYAADLLNSAIEQRRTQTAT
ncbi:MAG: hypothetical protein R3175_14360 [Marinobacter sp.]|uniref:hypothetical protein n=1 Tax=Marinobacter sp. TaxID=50741 RepID=UPI00299D3DDC|nr:hypothetical protein [Marinobacter sp.]MDX1757236.1 hypothetical protein [Marinobacter sp.]